MTPAQKRAQTRATNKARDLRIKQEQERVREIVATGICPECGRKLKRNWGMAGWWQCSQFGSEQFRAQPELASCGWQGFTE